MDTDVELLTDGGNYAIIKIRGRAFPGIVFSGDSTMIMYKQINDIIVSLDNDIEEAKESCLYLKEDLEKILEWYEAILKTLNFELPYSRSILSEKLGR